MELNLNLMNTPIYSTRYTRANVIEWLQKSGLDDTVLQIMVKEVKLYPVSALEHYCKNINFHLLNAQNFVKKNRNNNSTNI